RKASNAERARTSGGVTGTGVERRRHLSQTATAPKRMIAATATHQPCCCQNEGRNSARGGRRAGMGSSAARAGLEAKLKKAKAAQARRVVARRRQRLDLSLTHCFSGGRDRLVSPLTPALSPLRGEGERGARHDQRLADSQ